MTAREHPPGGDLSQRPDGLAQALAIPYRGGRRGRTLESRLAEGEIEQKAQQMARFKEMYKNSLFVILVSYAEVLPIATIIALISALILKRKPGLDAAAEKNKIA
jgi:hypothetical protein